MIIALLIIFVSVIVLSFVIMTSIQGTSNNQVDNNNNYPSKSYEETKEWIRLQKIYEKDLNLHYQIISKVKDEYSIWYNMGMPDDNRKKKIIDLCEKDISLAPKLKDYFIASFGELPNYESFKRLSIVYEKTKDYEKAHEVCLRALESGYISEGQGKTVHSRLARLEKKRS